MQLTTTEQTQIQFHYRQAGATISALLQLRIDVYPIDWSTTELGYIQNAIASCESAYAETNLGGGNLITEEVDDTDQDITVTSDLTSSTTTYGDKTKTIKKRASYQQRLTAYYREVEKLSRVLGVPIHG